MFKSPNYFHHDLSANKGGPHGAIAIDNIPRHFELLGIIMCQKSHWVICVEKNRHTQDVAPSGSELSQSTPRSGAYHPRQFYGRPHIFK